MKKKQFISILLALIVMFVECKAYALSFSYWYSNSNQIGRWPLYIPVVYIHKLNSNSSFYFTQGMNQAINQWRNTLDIDLSGSTSSTYWQSNLRFHGGTVAQINAYGDISYQSGTAGRTEWIWSYEGSATFASSTKYIYTISSAKGYVLDDGNSQNDTYQTCAHELGHSLGWDGHSSNSSDVMYKISHTQFTLTTRDKRHLQQVY